MSDKRGIDEGTIYIIVCQPSPLISNLSPSELFDPSDALRFLISNL